MQGIFIFYSSIAKKIFPFLKPHFSAVTLPHSYCSCFILQRGMNSKIQKSEVNFRPRLQTTHMVLDGTGRVTPHPSDPSQVIHTSKTENTKMLLLLKLLKLQPAILESYNGVGWKGSFKGQLVHPPCIEQGHLQLDRVAQNYIQPDPEYLQERAHLPPLWATLILLPCLLSFIFLLNKRNC